MPAAIDFYTYSAITERGDRTLSVNSEQFRETLEFELDQPTGHPRKHWIDHILRSCRHTAGTRLSADGRQPPY